MLHEQREGHSEKKEQDVRKKHLEEIQVDLYGWKLRFRRDKGRD